MERIFDKFFNLIDRLPLPYQFGALILLFSLIFVYKFLSNKKVQKSIIMRFQKTLGNMTEKDLQFHKLFEKKVVYKNLINNVKFDSVAKTNIFNIILTSKLNTDVRISKEFISNKENYTIDKSILCKRMIELINTLVVDYELKSMDELSFAYGEEKAVKLFDTVMNSPGGFREKRADRINRLILKIDEYLRYSQIFDNNIERIEYYLTEIQYSLRSTILEAEKSFQDLNGEIDKIINLKM